MKKKKEKKRKRKKNFFSPKTQCLNNFEVKIRNRNNITFKVYSKLKLEVILWLRHYLALILEIIDQISPFGIITMARRIWSSVTIMHFCALIALCLLLIGTRSGRAIDNEYGVQLSTCPIECDCQGLTVDCAHRGLTFVPRFIPVEARRL